MQSIKSTRQKSNLKKFFLVILYFFPAVVFPQPAQLDTTFNIATGANAGINELIIQPDDKLIVAGLFTNFNGTSAGRIIRLLPEGEIDTTWITSGGGADVDIRGLALQPDGKVLIGGIFSNYNGVPANRLVRLDSVGNIDPTFVAGTGPNNEVQGITVNSNRAVIRGFFNQYQGAPVPNFAVLQMNGSLHPSFNLPTEPFLLINDFHILPDDKLYLGGSFQTYNGQTVNRIVRLNADGSIDTTFNTGSGFNATVRRLLVEDSGDILVAGTFSTYDGSPVSRLVKLHANGVRDTSFNAVVPSLATLDALAMDNTGRVYMTGSDAGNLFLKRLLPDGSADTSFTTGIGFNGNITQLDHQSNNKLLVTGFFSLYQNQQAGRVARLTNYPVVVGIENIFTQNDMTIYPNPATDEVFFRINKARSEEIQIKVCDIHGRQIFEGKYNANEIISITTAGWLPGMYFVDMLNTNGDKNVMKLMKL